MGRDKPKIIAATADGIAEASAALKAGRLVVFPTETVYGLGADARNDRAVAAVFDVKGRPSFNPLIVHLPTVSAAAEIAVLDGLALKLAEAFWPGPFTLILPRRHDSGISLLVSAGLDSLAVRVPSHPVAQELLRQFCGPVAAPSANLSGRLSPTRAEHIADEFDGRVALILDGGPCEAGLESTIVRIADGSIDLLRPGSITPDSIEAVARLPVRRVEDSDNPRAPGQLKSHYAPRAELRLNAAAPEIGEAFLAFGPVSPMSAKTLNLSPNGNLTEAAANLFAMLRELDRSGAKTIAVMPIPSQGLGLAINDRLKRAAAPRPQLEMAT